MKKIFLQLCALASAVFLAFGATACGPEKIDGGVEIDKNKTQIYFRCFAGGFGKDYANYFAEEWNKTQEKYQVIPITEKFEYSVDLQPNWAIGNFENMDIVLAENLPVREAAKLGYIMDISGVWTSSAPDESGSIEGKMLNGDEYKEIFTVNGAQYSIPFYETLSGLVFDKDTFKQNGLLFGQNGTLISSPDEKLSAGKDGIEGNYDDGFPVNMSQWGAFAAKSSMLANTKLFLYPGGLPYYTTLVPETLVAIYEGVDNYMLNYLVEGTYDHDGVSLPQGVSSSFLADGTDITVSEGYKVYQMAGRYYAYDFIKRYMTSTQYCHPSTGISNRTQLEAQAEYIEGNVAPTGTNNRALFILEGNWWENEARNYFSTYNNTDYAYGKRDFSVMALPSFEAEGGLLNDKNVYYSGIYGSLVVTKQTDTAKLEKIKEFIKFLFKEENLRYFNATTGGLLPYEYTLQTSDWETMTKYAKNVYEIYHSDSTVILRSSVYSQYEDYSLGRIGIFNSQLPSGATTPYPVPSLRSVDAKTYFEGHAQLYNSVNWNSVLSLINAGKGN